MAAFSSRSASALVSGLVRGWSRSAAAASAPFSAAAAQAPQHAAAAATTAAAAGGAAAGGPAGTPRTLAELPDAQVLALLASGTLSPHRLEADVADPVRAVHLRRLYTAGQLAAASGAARTAADPYGALRGIPEGAFDTRAFYSSILNTNCEAVIGYVPLPVGVVGPLMLDGRMYRVPMATTEGALLASTNRGCTAIRKAGGASSVLLGDGITRAPLVRTHSLKESAELKAWVEAPANFARIAAAFDSTSRFAKLLKVQCATAGRNVYIRFKALSGDAMGMNMITKGVSAALELFRAVFPGMRVMALSGNLCTDKKPSAINWIEGRGKSVAAEVRLSGHVLRSVLKTSAQAMVDLNTSKNLVGSALAGSVGGFNAHASNVVTAVFLATGQDAAQNVESSTCLTLMEIDSSIRCAADPEGREGPGVVMTVTMPSVEVGTVGGGTSLPAQAACLELLGLRGSSQERAGANAENLARVVAGTVLAGELSLISALTSNDLLNAHIKLNRKAAPAAAAGAGAGAGAGAAHKAAAPQHGHGHGAGALLVTQTMLEELRAQLAHAATPAHAPSHAHYTTTYHAAGEVPGAAHTHTQQASAAVRSGPSSAHAHAHAAAAPAAAPLAHSFNAGHSATPQPLVAGGAPSGSHPHPLHTHSHGAAGGLSLFAASSPGRRYFAAPTAHAHMPRAAHASGIFGGAAWASAGAAPASAAAIESGADGAAAATASDEPRLSVP